MPLYTFRNMSSLNLEKLSPIVLNADNIGNGDAYSYFEENISALGEEGKVFVKLPQGELDEDVFLRLRTLFESYAESREKLRIIMLYESSSLSSFDQKELKAYCDKHTIKEIIRCQSLIVPDDVLKERAMSFRAMLFSFIEKKGITDVECYKRANIDRRTFSKIRSDDEYRPSKSTAIALGIALRLDSREFSDLLKSAGFALSGFHKEDVIVSYFISHGIYDIYALNEALFEYGLRPIGF